MGESVVAWILPTVMGITSLIGQNAQNKSAMANNDNQQAAALQNAQKARDQAMASIAPFTKPGAAPFANSQVQRPTGTPFAQPGGGMYGLPQTGGQVNAAGIMQGSGAQPQPQGGAPGMDPRMAGLFQQFLKALMAHAPQRQPQPIARQAPPNVQPQPQPPVQSPPQMRAM